MKFSPGDLVLTTYPLYSFNEESGTWVKIFPGTQLVYIEYHDPTDKIRVLLPGGLINWLDRYEEVYFELLTNKSNEKINRKIGTNT